MPGQETYYNQFGQQHKAAIMASPEPHLWTTDAHANGAVYCEMQKRVANQEHFIDKYFDRNASVLDIGCGFGRQAFLLAKKGFCVHGIDPSDAFVNIAKDLFARHNFEARFERADLMKTKLDGAYKNVLLFDVLEHIMPFRRRRFVKKVAEATQAGGIVIVSLPHDTAGTTWKKRIKQYFSYYTNKEEHPFAIPQKADVERLLTNLFRVVDSLVTKETDYYVLKRL